MKAIAQKIFGSANERLLKGLWPRVEAVNALEPAISKLSDSELRAKTAEFKTKLDNGAELDDILHEAFAVVRETGKRTLSMRHFDVQLIGGMVLNSGTIAEMKTGEGKTLVATLPVYLNALSGKGVHVVTVNDYLARRDAEWMSAIYSFLGMSTGIVVQGMEQEDVYAAYRADITYGQNNQFAFDYLRDNMKMDAGEMVQRGHNYAIIDEVDSILVDEARTPLIISGPSEKPTELYKTANELVQRLKAEDDFTVEAKTKQVTLTDDGVRAVEKLLGINNLYDPQHIDMVHHVEQALHAHNAKERDVDYLLRDGEILIVDEFTGRTMPGRRWSNGLHQAIEAKEGLHIQQESQTLASITFQNYFRMYDKLSGMTGTADTEAVEFKKIYGLEVVVIPTNKPMVRQDNADVVFASERGKYKSACEEIAELHQTGQPVLVGTASIAKSELVSTLLKQMGIRHNVLNAKNNQGEAYIVAQAGRLGAVTISTNMAGRGTDIVLGGNPEFLAEEDVGTRDPEDPEFKEAFESYEKVCAEEKQKVLDAGGLFVLGTERHESRRIDNQLRGRSGRQGDPGASRFYVSLEDDLMRRFGGERMQAIMARVGLQEDEAIEGPLVARAIENAQKKVEGFHFDMRKHLLEYDDVNNKQREIIYAQRAKILKSDDVQELVKETIPDVIEEIITSRATEQDDPTTWDVEGMVNEFNRVFGAQVKAELVLEKVEDSTKVLAQTLFDEWSEMATKLYSEQKERLGEDHLKELEKWLYLKAINHYWKEHLSAMDHLKEGINLRGYAQKNPLHEYQREALFLFQGTLSAINFYILSHVFNARPLSDEQIQEMEDKLREEQRREEQRAKEIHEEATKEQGDAGEGAGAADSEGLNRRQRRRQEAQTKKQAGPAMSRADYMPSKPSGQSSSKNKRKKNKAARKARRQSR